MARKGAASASGLGIGSSIIGPDTASGELGEAEAHADLGRAGVEGSLISGPMKVAGKGEAYAGAKGSASAGITNEGTTGSAGVLAGGEVTASVRANAGPFGVYARAEGMAGVEAGVNAGAGLDGLHMGADALSGAKGSISAGADVGGINAGVTAEGYAGPGAEASFNLNRDKTAHGT